MSFPFGRKRTSDDRRKTMFGGANFVKSDELKKMGVFHKSSAGLYCGLLDGKPLFYNGDGGAVLIGGARSGKLTTILAQNLCAGIASKASAIILDLKGELSSVSQNQTSDRKHCRYWNPNGLNGMPQDRFNPVDYLTWSSPTLFADLKVFAENQIPKSGSANGEYFELRAREYLEAICLTLVKINGVLTLPDLYEAINLIPLNNTAWKEFAREMRFTGITVCLRVEEEIHASRSDTSGGFNGILGELFKSVSCLSDPVLLDSVSEPYDFSLGDLCTKKDQATHLYMICGVETIQPWAPVIKASFTGVMIHKSRRPEAPTINLILDECGQLTNYDLVPRLFSYGAGIGCRPLAVFQTASQMENLGKMARDIILSSAGLQMYFSVRDLPSAEMLSKMLGTATMDYDDPVQQGRAAVETHQLLKALLAGGDPFQMIQNLQQKRYESRHLSLQRRFLRNPDEVLTTPQDRMYVFMDGLTGPIYAERQPYWQQRFMAGRYHPNPYHPPETHVHVQTRWGQRTRKVITRNVPDEFADYPQYRMGQYSFIEGYQQCPSWFKRLWKHLKAS
ncbi:type IV secretory system conjugative DNA transfer family protein [uncultured Roseobacter sp.]|uniref:type IV secretory system conjugative DNA transfer family protein n=1 Tax=uncultured Roseobacter sp. TaxID=114847 RepID=UPI002628F857|nr:type IV secretory system conjugative DNA transfer family protein [uncultured Roseobacter sp.]